MLQQYSVQYLMSIVKNTLLTLDNQTSLPFKLHSCLIPQGLGPNWFQSLTRNPKANLDPLEDVQFSLGNRFAFRF